MITAWDIYWITRLDGINYFLAFFTVFSSISAFIALILRIFAAANKYFSEDGEDDMDYKENIKLWNKLKIYLFISSILIFCSIFIPSTKEAIVIYTIPKITNNQDVQQIPANFAKLINEKLQEWMKDVDILQKEKK